MSSQLVGANIPTAYGFFLDPFATLVKVAGFDGKWFLGANWDDSDLWKIRRFGVSNGQK